MPYSRHSATPQQEVKLQFFDRNSEALFAASPRNPGIYDRAYVHEPKYTEGNEGHPCGTIRYKSLTWTEKRSVVSLA